jgi:HlyD family secretion protein
MAVRDVSELETNGRRSTHRNRWIVAAAIAVLVVAIMLWRAWPERVEGAPVVRRDVARSLVLTGRVRPPARPTLGATVAGVVRSVLVREGDAVKAGQLLVQLDDAQAVAAVAEARAALAETRANTRANAGQAERLLREAEREQARARQLFDAGAISQRDVDEATRRAADARAAFEAATARAGAGGAGALADVARAQASLDAAQARLSLTRITSPAAGVVISRRVEAGDAVTPGQVLIELAMKGRTEIVAFASEESVGDLRLGTAGVVSADAYSDTSFSARITWIAPAIDPAQGTIEVRLDVPDPPSYLLPDMTVSVNVEVASRAAVLVVPRDAVQRIGVDSGWVVVEMDGRAMRKPVRVGIVADNGVEVVTGLAEGEIVLPSDVKPGARIRVAR